MYSSWAIYGRARSDNVPQQDLARLRKRIDTAKDDEAIPLSLRGFVASGPSKSSADGDDWGLTNVHLGGLATGGATHAGDRAGAAPTGSGAKPGKIYFFPLPYNDEQARIIDQLDDDEVVSVTGPPGTGKTHSIANIIGHYMATGRRVLVTAKTPEAIAAVREKLPRELSSLVIASAGSDRAAVKQLEDAIQRLSDEVVTLDVAQTRAQIARLEAEVAEIDAESRRCDEGLAAIAVENLKPISWSGG